MNYAHILLHIDKVLIQNHPFMNYAHMLLHIHKVHIQNHPFMNYAHIQLTDARQKSREARTLSEPSINNYARSNNKKETCKPNSLARLQSLKQSTTHDQHSRECISLKPWQASPVCSESLQNRTQRLTEEDAAAKTRDSLQELRLVTLKILVTFVLPRGGVDKFTVVLVDGPRGVLRAHEGAVQRDTVKGQQPLAQHAHSGEPATIHNILSGEPAVIHNILSGGPATIHILSWEPATIHNILSGEPATIHNILYGAPATIHNVLSGGPAIIHILSGEPATIHNILYQQHTCFRQLFAGMKVLKLFLMMWVLTQKQRERETERQTETETDRHREVSCFQ